MFFLLSSILTSAMIAVVLRFSEGRVTGKISMLAANYLTCLVLAGLFTGFGNLFPRTAGTGVTLGLGLVNGVLYTLGLLLMQYNIRKNGVVLSSVFSKLGDLLVPLALSIGVFREAPSLAQTIGALIAIGAIIVINYDKAQAKAEAKLLLLLLLLADGCASSMAKVFGEVGSSALSAHFLFYTFAAAFVCALTIALYRRERPGKAELLFGVLIGAPNFFTSRFLLQALERIPAVVAYPTRSVATIVLISLAGVLVFRERLQTRQWAALAAILVAVALLNL